MQTDERIRRARPDDVKAIVELVYGLAEYERAPQECRLTADQLQTALFGPTPAVFCHVAELDGEVVGCALWFLNFSTWRGVHGIYLEDLFVRPEQRGSGLGKALLVALAQECGPQQLRTPRVVRPRLEHPSHRLLQIPGRPPPRRMDHPPPNRHRPNHPRQLTPVLRSWW